MKRSNFSRSVLKNKISNNLVLIGKNSLVELFDKYHSYIECLIFPNQISSDKLELLLTKAREKSITVYFDSEALNYVESELEFNRPEVVAILKRRIERYLSLRDIKEYISELETCTVLAIPELDYEQNLGSIIRTSLALGVDFLLLSNRQQKVFTLTVTKVSMGYNYILPIVQENFLLAIQELKDLGFQILALDMIGENILDFSYNPKVCLVLGNEGKGISKTVLEKCDKTISIPMNSEVESLSVATTAGIILFDRLSKLSK